MYSLLFLALSSLLLCLLLTPVCRDAFHRAGLLDKPDKHRKTHSRAVPRVGGIPIAISFAAAFGLLLLSPLSGGAVVVQPYLPLVWKLLPAAAVVFATGLIDDLKGLRPLHKLAGQTAASVLAYWGGVRILGVAGFSIDNWWSLPLTVIWLVACTNAFNLIDGVDGLASGVGLFATLTTLVAALLQGNIGLALATAPLCGALLGFLRYNFNPASIFLGDSGSLLIGFLLGCYGVLWSHKSATLLAMTAPLMVLAIPILDTCLSIARRFLRHAPIFGADRGHIHHRLLDRGLTPRRVALLMYAVCGVMAAFSILQSVAHNQYSGVILILFCAVAWLGVSKLNYIEFGVAWRVLLGGTVRRVLSVQIRLHHLQNEVAKALTAGDCWLAIREAAPGFGFGRVKMRLLEESFEEQFGDWSATSSWTLRIPISDRDYVNLSGDVGATGQALDLAYFADALAKALQARRPELRATLSIDPQIAALAGSLAAYGSVNVISEPPAATATYCLPSNR
ncbi:MAG: MraY family glycosyltransferase [Bryobacteraceae bacterium]